MPEQPTQFDQTQYFKAVNPTTGLTDIFQNDVATGTPKYIDANVGKDLFAKGLNADLLQTKQFPNLTPPPPTTGGFNLDIPNVIDVNSLKDAFSGGLTKDDITKFTTDLKSKEADVAKNLVPTEREQGLMRSLAGITSGIEKAGSDLEVRPGIDFFTLDRGKSELQRKNELTVANLQRQIQIEQSTRGQNLEASKVLLDSAKTGYDVLLRGQEAIQNRATALFNVVNTLNTQSRDTFNSIITNLAGVTYDKLDAETKKRISTIAANLGIPESVIKQGLQIQADKMAHDREAQLFDQDIKKQQLAIERFKAGGGGNANGNYFQSSGTDNTIKGGKVSVDVANSYIDAFENAVTGLSNFSDKERAQSLARLKGSLEKGNYDSAKEQIIRLAFANQTGTQREDTIRRMQAIDSLKTVKTLLNQYTAKSGDTGLLKGSLENIAQKIGRTSDPELAKIGTRITQALQIYRNAVTGAAWGEQETGEYKQIFPSYKDTSKLNNAKIDSMLSALDANQRVLLGAYIGQDTYDSVFQVNNATAPDDKQIQADFNAYLKGSTPTDTTIKKDNPFQLKPTTNKPAASSFSFFN